MNLTPRLRRAGLLPGLVIVLAGASALAQEQPEPSAPDPMDQLLGQVDSLAAAQPDSASVADETEALVANQRPWYEPLIPILDARVTSNVGRISVTAGLEAPVGELVRMNGRARYGETYTTFRRLDKETEASNFDLALDGVLPGVGTLDVEVLRNTSYDESRTDNGTFIIDFDVREVRAALTGTRDLGTGLRAIWGVHTEAEDVDRVDRGVRNDRSLAGAGLTGGWGTRGPWHDFTARYGYEQRVGDRRLGDRTADASTQRDTLWARGNIDLPPRMVLSFEARRTTFAESRLDFSRTSLGQPDTAQVFQKIGDEFESRWENRWSADLATRLVPRVAVNAGVRHIWSETRYTFSKEGLKELGDLSLDAESYLRYAEAGSLRVALQYQDRANDLRPLDTGVFRGEEARIYKRADFQLRQQVNPEMDFHLDLAQTLTQNVNEAIDNLKDRDYLVSRADARLITEPWRIFRADFSAAYSHDEEINIDAINVENNRDEDFFEVRGNFTLDPDGGWRIVQAYRVQIRLTDYLYDDNRDQFNREGTWDNRLEYRFANGVSTDAQYLVNYQRTGLRDADVEDEVVYVYSGARRDHRVNAGIRIPVLGAELEMRTERGFLRDYSNEFRPKVEDRGRYLVGIRGNWQFWRDRAQLTLNASRNFEFGPAVREEQEDYWVANTSLRVAF